MTREFKKITRTVKYKDLLHVYNKHNTLMTLCTRAKERAITDKNGSYLRNLELDVIGKKNKREYEIKEYFDRIQKDLEENAILNLVATFEKLIFYKIPNTINNSKRILSSGYHPQEPFSSSIQSFIKKPEDIKNMSAILDILSGSISVTLENKLKEIVHHRNRIAHGKRFGRESTLTVPEALEKLDEVLESIV